MARNEEKAQSMLYRFREAQAAELGLVPKKRERRPALASSVNTVGECEKWRRQLLNMIARKVSKIQDVSLSDYQVRDLNDEINKLLREKSHWERRIRQLGGAIYAAPKMIDNEGREVPGNRGYKYFGRARDLPGVRELFEMETQQEPVSRSRTELYKNVDADYYGYRDEEDGVLVHYEEEREKQLLEEVEEEESTANEEKEAEKEIENYNATPFVPTRKQVEEYLVKRRKEQLMEKYVSTELAQNVKETEELTGQR
ncbi:pre-mrna-splicing factor isy1 homolog [Lichtheimia corymbifera JMRC:FSU:9682]|uniref:Pre-mrna-splicing factor isy1 homolog n=1 Tax=Lichtheimia corymbifera JMRC:FSU:9682 TaxID=1263082 RepID=A0A068RQI1_9FUNG|nr:pre-mrna-splicing factor isy1 homolog [Lichtheimia corymbifera JMRC:FSU:9682]